MDSDGPPRLQDKPRNWPILRIAVSLALIGLVLALPSDPQAFADFPAFHFPLEVIGLALLLSMLKARAFALLRWVATLFVAAILFLKLADIGTGAAFQRPFNPYLDLKILTDGWNLLSGAVGVTQAVGIICAGMLSGLLVAAITYWSLGGFGKLPAGMRQKSVIASGILLLACLALLILQRSGVHDFRVEAKALPYLSRRVVMVTESIADLARFEDELKQDQVSKGPHFSPLVGMDVVLIFIESYGRSAIEDSRYAASTSARLTRIEQELGAAGLKAKSGWLTSPTVGGLSWLAHGTLLSGLWTDSQARYDRMITSERRSLNSLFRASGWRTTAIMPAITMDWPEAGYFRYDSIYAAADLGYKGKPFNWVTMPDQYTLSAFERFERAPGHRPVMAEIALISSHAPWTPIPRLVEWDEIGDGAIFDTQAERGDPPAVIWSDPRRIRMQYLASVDYVLEVLGSYMARHGDDTLFILLGDHQPASIVTGEGASRDVPMHIISGRPELLRRLDGWNWRDGMIPARETPSYRMDEFRRMFVESFS